MSAAASDTINILANLLKVNNDRSEGYKKAADETSELDLKTILHSLADESTKNSGQLVREIKKQGGEIDPAITSTSGKIHRAWMGVKASLTGRDRRSVLRSCEREEDAAQSAYKEAIASASISTDLRQLIRNQQVALKAAGEWIQNYKDKSSFGYVKML